MQRILFMLMLVAALVLSACAPDSPSSTEADTAVDTVADTTEATMEPTEEPAEEPADAEAEATAEPAEESADAANDEATSENATADEAASAAGARTFTIVSDESSASYLVDETFFAGAVERLGMAQEGEFDIVGTTGAIEGELSLNLDDLQSPLAGEGRFTVDLTGLSTDQSRRDRWVQENGDGPQFGQFPTAEFVATSIEGAPESYSEGEEVSFQLVGDMTIRDVTQPMTFDVTATLAGDTISGTATSASRLSDWGFNPPNFAGTLSVKDDFMIQVDFTAQAQ